MHRYITQAELDKMGAPGWMPKAYDKHGDLYLGTIKDTDYLDAEKRGCNTEDD